jgi:hypothetical protein
MISNEDLAVELEQIRQADPEKQLRPKAVVDAAREPTSPLHESFEWNDTEAAERYRLGQARRLIRVAVTVLPRNNEKVRAYVSLSSDRHHPEEDEELGAAGGYRSMTEVLAADDLRAIMLNDALRDLQVMERKYAQLSQLAGVFEEAAKVRAEEEAAATARPGRRRRKKAKKKTGARAR